MPPFFGLQCLFVCLVFDRCPFMIGFRFQRFAQKGDWEAFSITKLLTCDCFPSIFVALSDLFIIYSFVTYFISSPPVMVVFFYFKSCFVLLQL